MEQKTAIILLAHGSRRKEANQEVAFLAGIMEKDTLAMETEVGHAFLQFVAPSLEESIRNFIEKGYNRIAIAPLFLTSGVHIQEDIPEILEKIKTTHPDVNLVLCRPLGCDSRLLPIIRERVEEGLGESG